MAFRWRPDEARHCFAGGPMGPHIICWPVVAFRNNSHMCEKFSFPFGLVPYRFMLCEHILFSKSSLFEIFLPYTAM